MRDTLATVEGKPLLTETPANEEAGNVEHSPNVFFDKDEVVEMDQDDDDVDMDLTDEQIPVTNRLAPNPFGLSLDGSSPPPANRDVESEPQKPLIDLADFASYPFHEAIFVDQIHGDVDYRPMFQKILDETMRFVLCAAISSWNTKSLTYCFFFTYRLEDQKKLPLGSVDVDHRIHRQSHVLPEASDTEIAANREEGDNENMDMSDNDERIDENKTKKLPKPDEVSLCALTETGDYDWRHSQQPSTASPLIKDSDLRFPTVLQLSVSLACPSVCSLASGWASQLLVSWSSLLFEPWNN